MSTQQRTLDGETVEQERVKPQTLWYNPQTGEYVLRSRRFDSDVELVDPTDYFDDGDDNDGVDMDADEIIGGVYNVEIHRSVEYRLKLPATSQHRAKEIAEDMVYDETPCDRRTVHTRTRELDDVTRGELPDDYDPYGGERLIDVFEEMNEEEDNGTEAS